jgi:hypothetical protein
MPCRWTSGEPFEMPQVREPKGAGDIRTANASQGGRNERLSTQPTIVQLPGTIGAPLSSPMAVPSRLYSH